MFLMINISPHGAVPGHSSRSSLTVLRRCKKQCQAHGNVPYRAADKAGVHHTGVRDKLNSKRINGVALEMIMRDVLHGMQGFTTEACSGSEAGRMEILAVEEAENTVQESPTVIPFPGKNNQAR